MTIPARQPYAGELVFTAFSGSHQDAIKERPRRTRKSSRRHTGTCRISRLTRRTIGREYREVHPRQFAIRQRAASAYLLESEFGIEVAQGHGSVSSARFANDAVDNLGRLKSAARNWKAMFWQEYVERVSPWQLKGFETESKNGVVKCRAKFLRDGKPVEFSGEGNGPLAALVHGITQAGGSRFEISN